MRVYKKLLFLIMGTDNKSDTECTICEEENNNRIKNDQNYVWHRRYERNLLLEPPTFANVTPWFRRTQFDHH